MRVEGGTVFSLIQSSSKLLGLWLGRLTRGCFNQLVHLFLRDKDVPHFLPLSSWLAARWAFTQTQQGKGKGTSLQWLTCPSGDRHFIMLFVGWGFSAPVSLQAYGKLKEATVTSHVRRHSCPWSPRDMDRSLVHIPLSLQDGTC